MQLLLLLMSVSLCICSIQGLKSQSNGGVNGDVIPNLVEKSAKNPAAAVASSIRRGTSWKLADEEACREDVTRLCPKKHWPNNLAVLECLQDRKEVRKNRCIGYVSVKNNGCASTRG